MSSFTENYDFIKPSAEDYYDIQDFNENMDAIDTQLAAAEKKAAQVQEKVAQAEAKLAAVDTQLTQAEKSLAAISGKIGSPDDSGTDTLFGCMNNTSASPVKSIQHVTYPLAKSSTGKSISISAVDPSKCIVIFERLEDRFSYRIGIDYTLSATALTVKHSSYGVSDFNYATFGFWIVEFN